MKCNFIIILFFSIVSLATQAQEIQYDTTYQVTFDNGIKDSVIIITKKVTITEKVYMVDSTVSPRRWGLDIYCSPFLTTLTSSTSQYSADDLNNTNEISGHIGKSIGGNIYYTNKNVELRFGLNIIKHTIKNKSTSRYYREVTNTYLINDTLDIYYSVVNRDTIPNYIIEQIEENRLETKIENLKREALSKVYYFEMAMQGGYKKISKNWNFYLYAGPVIGFYITSNGNTLNERGERVRIQNEKVSSPIFHIQGNLQISYKLNENTQLYIEPFYQKYLFSINQSTIKSFNKDLTGIRLGLKIFL